MAEPQRAQNNNVITINEVEGRRIVENYISNQNGYKDCTAPNEFFNRTFTNLRNIQNTRERYQVINPFTGEVTEVTKYQALVSSTRDIKIEYHVTNEGIKHGNVKAYYSNNKLLCEVLLINGIQHGNYMCYNQDDTIRCIIRFNNGIVLETVDYPTNSNTVVTRVSPFKNDKLHGVKLVICKDCFYRIHYDNGIPQFISQCVTNNNITTTLRYKLMTAKDTLDLILTKSSQTFFTNLFNNINIRNINGIVNYVPAQIVETNENINVSQYCNFSHRPIHIVPPNNISQANIPQINAPRTVPQTNNQRNNIAQANIPPVNVPITVQANNQRNNVRNNERNNNNNANNTPVRRIISRPRAIVTARSTTRRNNNNENNNVQNIVQNNNVQNVVQNNVQNNNVQQQEEEDLEDVAISVLGSMNPNKRRRFD